MLQLRDGQIQPGTARVPHGNYVTGLRNNGIVTGLPTGIS